MAKARLEIAFGPDYSESRTLTWKHDGLVILPTGNASRPLLRKSTYGSGSFRYEILGDVPNHLLWFTVYLSENTAFLDTTARDEEQRFLIGELVYVTKGITHIYARHAASRMYVQLISVEAVNDK